MRVYLCKARGKTNDAPARQRALQIWEQKKAEHKHTPKTTYTAPKRVHKDKGGFRDITTLGGVIDAYCYYQKGRAKTGAITWNRYRTLAGYINRYLGYFFKTKIDYDMHHPKGGAKKHLSRITLSGFQQMLKRFVRQEKIKLNTARQIWWGALDLYTWAEYKSYSNYVPNTKYMKWTGLPQPKTDIKIFTKEEIKELLTHDKYKQRRYPMEVFILLGLQCGFLSKEISTLRKSHIHFNKDNYPVRITKVRVKTNTESSWVLFESTALLLNRYLMQHPDIEEDGLIFTTKSGRSLNYGTATSKQDYIGRAFRFLCNRVNVEDKSFYHFRKTGASFVGAHSKYENVTLEAAFLAHRLPTMARQSYVKLASDTLDNTIEAMEKHFGIMEYIHEI